ncbi:hypothetical protein [Lichenifustis flavocetrariae]|uniref:Uncharacterized protein n=1 Tax=Lichenifustis flavocetrariae TaxID=2949735 RepID=A0AA41Z9N9_9HYPH|nr:hypothetical protein [Lichenifustis flavocetrariae]MCW6511862.1 hypothetical protein [Lichenifustis flavocetrariae]
MRMFFSRATVTIRRKALLVSGIVGLLTGLVAVGSSSHAQTTPVPMNGPFGPGKIDASLAPNFVNQHVSACGRVTSAKGNIMLVGSNLWVFTPHGVDPTQYYNRVICVSGSVTLRDAASGGIRVPSIDATSTDQIDTDPNTVMPQNRCRPCEKQQPDGTCRRFRACT